MTRATRTVLFTASIGWLASAAAAEDAWIGTSGTIRTHEGAAEDIHDHEGRSYGVDSATGHTEQLSAHEARAEDIHRHEASSGTISTHEGHSERLTGFGHARPTAEQGLASARAKLEAARERHHHASTAPAPASPAGVDEAQWQRWASRLDIARHRVDVARENMAVMDERYADMIRNDYPRGDARVQLIDQRSAAQQRLAAEQATLPRLVQRARRDGVPESVLFNYENRQ